MRWHWQLLVRFNLDLRLILKLKSESCSIKFSTNPLTKLHVEGDARIKSLAGSGTRNVVCSVYGDLIAEALPTAFAEYFSGDIYTTRTFSPSYEKLKKDCLLYTSPSPRD